MKESMNLVTGQQKLYKLKIQREKKFKKTKKQNNIQKLWYNSKWYNIHVIGILGEERIELKKYVKK